MPHSKGSFRVSLPGENNWREKIASVVGRQGEPPAASGQAEASETEDPKLQALLERIERLSRRSGSKPLVEADPPQELPAVRAEEPVRCTRPLARRELLPPSEEVSGKSAEDQNPYNTPFVPPEPETLEQTGLAPVQVEALALKYLLAVGAATGRQVAEQLHLPFGVLEGILRQMKLDQLVVYAKSAPMGDYLYQLTDMGRERARRYMQECSYHGAAPVPLEDYVKSVALQSLTRERPSPEALREAFSDLLINPRMFRRLGPAIYSGRGMFLYGAPGNGKTSIAERVTKAFGTYIWIPRAIVVDGEIIRLFDPSNHDEVPLPPSGGLIETQAVDRRWVRIRRPTIVVGGELTMDNLEVTVNRVTGICEAPLQLKSNCGTLVIDDFGRQKMSIDQLLNRWIVPLEKRVDFLNLPNGKKIQVPFDQLIVFSTNLEPRDLVDEAFLRRIPYKIEVLDPTEEEFRELFRMMAQRMQVQYDEAALDYLIEKHYRQAGRSFRCCHPRDLLSQIICYCQFLGQEPRMTPELFDLAVENYFSVM